MNIAEVFPSSQECHKKWVAVTRRKLIRLLMGDKPPTIIPQTQYKVIASGDKAIESIRKQMEFYFAKFPEEIGKYWYFEYKWKGPITWDTHIIEYQGWHNDNPVRAILRIPHDVQNAPAVLCIHGHMRGLAAGKEEVNFFAEPLTAAGFVTLSPDALPFGPRRNTQFDEWEYDYHKGGVFLSEKAEFCESLLRGETLMGIQIWELMRGVDTLCSIPQVNNQKIGSIGCSQGGVHTWWLSALDKRISAAVVSAGVTTYAEWEKQHAISALYNFVPGIMKIGDQPQIISLIAPRPLMLLDCEFDGCFPLNGLKEAGKWLKKIYRLYGASNYFKQIIEHVPHGMTPQGVGMGIKWMQEWLQ